MSDGDGTLKVLSVVGAGRSGTTVLASILGEVDGVVSAGELRWLWERGVLGGRPCACGAPPSACPVWAPVVRAAQEAVAGRSAAEVVRAQHAVARRSSFPRALRAARDGAADWPEMDLVRRAYGAALTALADVSGAHLAVDISKRPIDAAVVAGLSGVDHYVLHLVRDPRAVVHSWRRGKTFEAAGQTLSMGTRGLPSTVRRWAGNSLWAEGLRRTVPADRWMHLRYEDLAASPRAQVARLLDFLGEPGRPPFLDERTVLLGPNHIVAGNPSRFTTGEVTVRPDEEWRHRMPVRDQRLVEALALPLMLHYRYRPGR